MHIAHQLPTLALRCEILTSSEMICYASLLPSQDMRFSGELVRLGAVARCMDWLREGRTVQHVDLVTKLLCNVTTLEQGSTDLLQLGEGDLEGFNMCAHGACCCLCNLHAPDLRSATIVRLLCLDPCE